MTSHIKTNIQHFVEPDSRFDFEVGQRFIEIIRGDADAKMEFRVLPESSEAKERLDLLTPEERQKKRRNFPGTLKQLGALFQKANKAGHGIFVALNEFDGNGRKKENLIAAHVIPLDLDGAPLPEKWVIPPHWIQRTSPGRYQCFFVIERTTDIAAVESVTRRMASYYRGDLAVCDATHVFRVTGFYHQKRKPVQIQVIASAEFDPPYTLSDFEFLPALPDTDVTPLGPVGIGVIDATLSKEVLGQLDPTKFSNNDDWVALAMALHASCGGNKVVRDHFMDWCDEDTSKDYSRAKNIERWNSFRLDKPSLRSAGTLLKICREHSVPEPTLQKLSSAVSASHAERASPMIWDMNNANEMVEYAQSCMLEGGAPLYQTGGRLVYPVQIGQLPGEDDGIRRPPESVTIQDVKSPRLQLFMIEHAKFQKSIRGTLVPYPPTEKLATLCLAAPDVWQFPTLNGIISAPTLRADGSLLDSPGYDPQSGLLLDMRNVQFPSIEAAPTREAAIAALKLLKEPFRDFPCIKDGSEKASASRTVLLSMVLTGLVRRTLPSAPVHGVTAPTPGTGKTLAIQSASTIILGRQVTAMSQGSTPEEDEKRLFAVLMRGDGVLMIDNVTRPIAGDALCTILTEETWQCRVLGESRNVSVKTNALITATGNNLVFGGDMTRRALLCRMDAGLENPEGRAFDRDLRSWVPANRTRLVAAGLTVLRAFVCAGRPGLSSLQPFGSFEAWSNLVRGALVWLGEPDPCLTRKHVVADDPVKGQLAALFGAIYDATKGRWFTAAELLKQAHSFDDPDTILQDILYAVVPRASSVSLGLYLKSHDSKIIGGLTLQSQENKHKKCYEYRVKEVGANGG